MPDFVKDWIDSLTADQADEFWQWLEDSGYLAAASILQHALENRA